MKPLNPQAGLVLAHLRTNEHLTSWQAEGVYRIRRLASRVDELRASGFEIETETARDATGQRYTRYALTPAQRQAESPLLEPRVRQVQFSSDDVTAAYFLYCVHELGHSRREARMESNLFVEFLKENQ